MKIADFVEPSHIRLDMRVRDKKALLRELAEMAANATGLPSRQVYRALLERESASCTGMGAGVAIPHARFSELERVHGFFVRLSSPVKFGAPDKAEVDIVFLLLSPASSDTFHVKALAAISRLLRNRGMVERLRMAADTPGVAGLLKQAEEAA